jgi:hypothetical protein
MIEITLKISQTEKHGYEVAYCPEFESLSSQQKLDMLTDAVIELNKKWSEVDGNYQVKTS